MQRPVLNLDILDQIIALSDRTTLLSIMQTSHELYESGMKHLQRKIHIFWLKEKLDSFLHFCEAGGQVTKMSLRMKHLRGLDIYCEECVLYDKDIPSTTLALEATARALTRFFTSIVPVYGRNFTHLGIASPEVLCSADPSLPLAIASLTTLTYLAIHHGGEYSIILWSSLKSRLVEAQINIGTDGDPSHEDVTALLRGSEETIRKMTLYNAGNPTGVVCYANLHTLKINHVGMPMTRHYVSTFPNLQVLHVGECISQWDDESEELMERRSLNVAQQIQDGSWRTLREYSGSILFLYMLGLTCPVMHADVYDNIWERIDLAQVPAIVTNCTVQHLKVTSRVATGIVDRAVGFLALCEEPGFHSVKTFDVAFTLSSNDRARDMKHLLVSTPRPSFALLVHAVPRTYLSQEYIKKAVCRSSLLGFGLIVTGEWTRVWRDSVSNESETESSDQETGSNGQGSEADEEDSGSDEQHAQSDEGDSESDDGVDPTSAWGFLDELPVDALADELLDGCKSLKAVRIRIGSLTAERGPQNVFYEPGED